MSRPPEGLPEHLPEGERLLWQGTPSWRALATRAFHVRGLAAYFAVLLAWSAVNSLRHGAPLDGTALSTLRFAGLAAVPVLLVVLYAWAVSRATTYTLTDRRIVIRLGLALPMTINLPFARIDSAAFHPARDGTGDIALQLAPGNKLAYLVLWPHARPWRVGRPEPMLRAVPEGARVAQLVARSLAASADMPTQVVTQLQGQSKGGKVGTTLPHAASA